MFAVFTAALCLAASGNAFATTPLAVVEFHDFKNGPSVIRKSFDDAWEGRTDLSFQSFTCTASPSLIEHDGRRDERPIKVGRITLLGAKGQTGTSPAYLVEGIRTLWLARSGAISEYVELPCTWLVTFNGNQIGSVREAGELSYLLSGEH